LRVLFLGGLALFPNVGAAAELKAWSGGPAPALDLSGLDGRRYRLADLRGNVVLINFWATWCAPCRDEMPSIQRLKDRLAGRPFVALAVNLDEPEARVRKFLLQGSLDLTVLLDPGRQAARAWNARILPASFLIGPEGAIRYTVIGEINWDDSRVASLVTDLLSSDRGPVRGNGDGSPVTVLRARSSIPRP
jgi:thiol-disulfide isomerase/thioredoxin